METTPETTKPVAAKPPVKRVKRKAKPAAKKAKPAAAKKALKKSRKPKASLKHPESKHVAKAPGIQNKAEFIRSLPKDMPAKEVVAKAKLRGTQLTESYVYNTRGLAKLGKGGAKRVRVPSNPSHVLVATVGGGGGGGNGQAKPLDRRRTLLRGRRGDRHGQGGAHADGGARHGEARPLGRPGYLGPMSTALILIAIGFYWIPTILAVSNRKANAGAIGALNFFLGWTLIGWVVALVWAMTVDPRRA